MSLHHGHTYHSATYHEPESAGMWHYQQPSALEGHRQPQMQSTQSPSTPLATPESSYMLHPQAPILEPVPTRRIDTQQIELVSDSPELYHTSIPHTPQQHYRSAANWVQSPEHEYYSYDIVKPNHATYLDYGHSNLASYSQYSMQSPHYPYHDPYHTSYIQQTQQMCAPHYYTQSQRTSYPPAPAMQYQPVAQSQYTPYTPAPSNPSSGTSTPREEHAVYHGQGYDVSDSLVTPVTPSNPPVIPWLLLGQSTVAPSALHHVHPAPPQDCDPASLNVGSVHASHSLHTPPQKYCAPPSPVSPINHGSPRKNSVFAAQEVTGVDPSAIEGTPATRDVSAVASPIVSVVTPATLSREEERLKKLRDRRHVVACTFCRGRKIACHSGPKTDEAEGSSRPSEQDGDFKPVIRGSKRNSSSNKPPCDNCIRRGRECVYPPRAARSNRRRRREPREQTPESPVYEEGPQ